MTPPEPAQVQPSCDPHGRSEAEESRTGLNPVCLPWLQLHGPRSALSNDNIMLIGSLIRPEVVYEETVKAALLGECSSSLSPSMTNCLAYDLLQWPKMNDREFSHPSKTHTQMFNFYRP